MIALNIYFQPKTKRLFSAKIFIKKSFIPHGGWIMQLQANKQLE